MKKSTILFSLLLTLATLATQAQLLVPKTSFTRADSLHGNQNAPLRTCYDINYYHLDVKFDIEKKFISGSTQFKFTATRDLKKLQFDLFANLKVEKVVYKGKVLPVKREFNAVYLTFPLTLKKGTKNEFTVFYSGNPTIAKRAPWDGGVVFTTDSLGKPWVNTACEGVGASIWWPNKDQLSDEVDSILISVSVPTGLKDVSNGRLRKVTDLKNGYTKFDWFVSNPINNYDVEANIGNYVHFDDTYMGENGKLTLDYWVLPYNLEKAKKQFGANVKPMLKAFEHWFGPYPFYADGYKLIETSHLGMEHQSGVAYGNKYRNGYSGRDLSGTGKGLNWDFIVVHESGHEWFGNNITDKDNADMWIHESFANYSESLFIEDWTGSKESGQEYVHGTRRAIVNDRPIIGFYGVNKEGSGDMYYKGGNMLNMVRTIINDDEKWRGILRGLNKDFYHQTVTTEQVVDYINTKSGMNLTSIFDQYLRYKNIPTLEIRFDGTRASAKWASDVQNLIMPVRIRAKGGEWVFVTPGGRGGAINIPGLTKDNLEVDTFNYYIGVLVD